MEEVKAQRRQWKHQQKLRRRKWLEESESASSLFCKALVSTTQPHYSRFYFTWKPSIMRTVVMLPEPSTVLTIRQVIDHVVVKFTTSTLIESKAFQFLLTRRRIATMKGRSARSASPVKAPSAFPSFGAPQPSDNAPQSGFSFGQTNSTNTSTINTFSFGQTQPSTSTSFNFGAPAPQQPGSNSFTFGQSQPQQSGGFTFGGAPSTSVSFPPAGNNPFGSANGASTASPSSGGFKGSIFSVPPSTSSGSSLPTSNGFSFGSNTSSAPFSQTPQSAGLSDSVKADILRREPYLDPAQQRKLEEIIGTHLPDVSVH